MAHGPGPVMGPDRKIVQVGKVDGDAIRMLTSSKIWIDHNTLYDCKDGLIDVTRGSTSITISNNWFRFQDKVMLLGHNDGYRRDKNMRVTVAFNHFGPRCQQRMPRYILHFLRYYQSRKLCLGGSMNPSIKSEANLFIAPEGQNKEVTWDPNMNGNFKSKHDVFENGACFGESVAKGVAMSPNYTPEQIFEVADGRTVRALTRSAGALKCPVTSRC
ncbi:UNVERIFIED_CONTAM: putative pectate lyase 4 [Sesamum calycinum]|uniref:Pectate lyase n=1 Tax=Sesamum calycinum TaxID=2727403 RepID=A0AAW2NFJ0_9LAMI